MSLLETLKKDMLSAIKSGQSDKSGVLKMLLATVKNEQIKSEKDLDDKEIEKILRKESKKVQDSISQYEKMGREDLIAKEKSDLEIIDSYLPELMPEEEIEKIVQNTIEKLNAKDMRDMGKVMGLVMKELNGKADGNTVKNIVQKNLG